MHLSLHPRWLRLLSIIRRWFCCCSLVYCYSHCGNMYLFYVLLYVTLCPFLFCYYLDGEERELVALLSLSSWRLVIVVWLLLVVSRVCLHFVIVVFPDHTHLQLFYARIVVYRFYCIALYHSQTRRHNISYDVVSGSEITPCNKIDRPQVVYRCSGNVMPSITTLRT